MAANDFASATGPRTTGNAIVVMSVTVGAAEITALSAVGESSHGRRKT
jgi:hypothetical protein